MALRSDFQNLLEVFVYQNLAIIMNPSNASNVVISTVITPTTPTTPLTPVTPSASMTATPPTPLTGRPTLFISPDLLNALQTAAIDNFTSLGLPPDIQEIVREFFANLPPIVPVVSTTPGVPVNSTVL